MILFGDQARSLKTDRLSFFQWVVTTAPDGITTITQDQTLDHFISTNNTANTGGISEILGVPIGFLAALTNSTGSWKIVKSIMSSGGFR
jgi:hypothetical protein